jgi:hypothetical protein
METSGLQAGELIAATPFTPPTLLCPPFLLRYENVEKYDRISEINVEAFDLSNNIVDRWDSILWNFLTPSDYERVQMTFVLRLWRRPQWVERTLCRKDEISAEANLRGILNVLRRGDTLWIHPARAHETRSTGPSTARSQGQSVG